MDFNENQELAAWLEEGLQYLFNIKPVSAAIVAQLPSGEVFTGYFNADSQRKAVLAHSINADAMLDVVLNNIGMIREALDSDTGGDSNENI